MLTPQTKQTHNAQKKGGVLHTASILLLGIIFTSQLPAINDVFAQEANETVLQEKIESRKADIEALEAAIAKDQLEINRLGGQKQTLQNEMKLLDLNGKKLTNDIALTEKRIEEKNFEISRLSLEIGDKETKRLRALNSLAESLRGIRIMDDITFQETLLSSKSISNALEDVDRFAQIQVALDSHLASVIQIKTDLQDKKGVSESKRAELATYKTRLADQKSIVDYNKKVKDGLLATTKNQESAYKKLLAEKLAKKNAFESELLSFEAQLRLITDPSALPAPGKLLSWPVKNVVVTQEFGDTDFARSKPGLYSGGGHNGIDLRAPVGSSIFAAAAGVVEGFGDTDTVCPGASYGKWVLIRHSNGLSTLYAHLSLIKVSTGTTVQTGDLVGYAGMTGYTTGPHLHFTVYATQGVKIMDRPSKACGGTYRMPVADLRAYLNPLLYL